MKKISLIILFICACWAAHAQSDVSLWTGGTVEKKITKKLGFNIGAQVRMPDNVSYTQSYLGELGVYYKPLKGMEVSAYYRFINKRKDETKEWKNRHRFYYNVSYGKKFGKFKVEDRLRFQYQFKDNDGEIGYDKSYFRNKIEVEYDSKSDFTPFVSADLFYQIGGGFNQIRPKAGVSYKINKKNALQLSVFKDVAINTTAVSQTTFVVGYKLKF